VLEIRRQGIDSALYGLAKSSIHDLTPDDALVPERSEQAAHPSAQ
jgi:pre-mycofactocin synthase